MLRITNVFVARRDQLLHRDIRVPRYMLDTKDHDWFWRIASNELVKPDNKEIDYNLSRGYEAHQEETRNLDPFNRHGLTVTESKLKEE